jgi:membrane protein YdbS with pleckstrin-like domain
MRKMKASTRLFWVAVIIIGSSLYAVLIAWNRPLTTTLTVGYIAVILTIFVSNELWKKKPDDG